MKRIILAFTVAVFGLSFFATTASAKKRMCKARYTFGSKTTPFYNLGKVGGFLKNKKKKCLALAKSKAAYYVKKNTRKSTSLCGKKVRVWVDSEVQGKKNSRDGSIYLANYGYTCKVVCSCPRGYRLSGRTCYRTVLKRVSSCKLPADLKVSAPYRVIRGYLYKSYTARVAAKCGWRVY